MKKLMTSDPDFKTACAWWPELRNVWTPIGWKDHLFRFNVFYNGTILAEPSYNNRRTGKWKGQGLDCAFLPATIAGEDPLNRRRCESLVRWLSIFRLRKEDDHSTMQGWNEIGVPVLWTEWSNEGLLLRQEVFAHVQGGRNVKRGDEPLFAWVRLRVHDLCNALPLEKAQGFLLSLTAPHSTPCMETCNNIKRDSTKAAYPRRLSAQTWRGAGLKIVEPDGRIRLGILPGGSLKTRFARNLPNRGEYALYLEIAARRNSHADLLIPMLPSDRGTFDREASLGYEGALAETRKYWRETPKTAARISIPEKPLEDAARTNIMLAQIISEKNPADGKYSLLSGSWEYSNLWATPYALTSVMLLDGLGYHSFARQHMLMFRNEQGTVNPPGDAYSLHPGYLSSPKTLTSIDWLSDHGAILYAVASHALITGDREFTEDWMNVIVKACEFIRDSRANTRHPGVPGIMPPAVATDKQTRIQAVWNDGWCYKGLTTAVRLMERIKHPRAAEFVKNARDYGIVFRRAFREKCRRMPTWTAPDGRRHPLTPTSLHGDVPEETRHAFYLDTGPLFLVFAGLFDARDPLMRATLTWFREGPQRKLFRPDSLCWQVPCLNHELSSCEPGYSWNVCHSHALGDRRRFLEAMYGLFAGAMSRQTWISCETRHGITGTIFNAGMAVRMMLSTVIDDQLKPGELHLLRLVPCAWLKTGTETVFEKAPTEFGPASLRFRLENGGRMLNVVFRHSFHHKPEKIVAHVPPIEGLKSVRVNNRKYGDGECIAQEQSSR